MRIATRLGLFALVLAVVFAGAYGVGAVARPGFGLERVDEVPMRHIESDGPETGGHDGRGVDEPGPGGLAIAAEGYALHQMATVDTAGVPGEYVFQIVDVDGRPVTGFQLNHDRRLHLVVVRRDLVGFQHLHPEMSGDGTWRAPLTLPAAGDWRVFADFRPDGLDRQIILGVDVPVRGDYRPVPLLEPGNSATVDGYTIVVNGKLTAGSTSRLTFSVATGGAPVADLQPYLGAFGHLVALRAGDLGYLHVHPQQTHTAGPEITFDVEVPTPGFYRLFLDFQHAGVVRTASLTAVA
jgi:hypothetical protein